MQHLHNFFNIKIVPLLAWLGGILAAALGGFDVPIKTLIFFVVFDYITGVIVAWVNKKVSSEVAAKGLIKKVGMFILVAASCFIDNYFGQTTLLRNLVIGFYISVEGISLTENWVALGLPMPPMVIERLEQIKKQ